jgi:ribosome-associated translation inhibitor RaiA
MIPQNMIHYKGSASDFRDYLVKNYDMLSRKLPYFFDLVIKIEVNLDINKKMGDKYYYWQLKCYGKKFSIDVRSLGRDPYASLKLAVKNLSKSFQNSTLANSKYKGKKDFTYDEQLMHKKILDIEPMEDSNYYDKNDYFSEMRNVLAVS